MDQPMNQPNDHPRVRETAHLVKRPMNFWLLSGRILTIAGIIGGIATAGTLVQQLYEANSRQWEQKVQNWQSAIVYQIIEKNQGIWFDGISESYVNEAQKTSVPIPREKLTNVQLRLVLMGLISKNIISHDHIASYCLRPLQRLIMTLWARVIESDKPVLTLLFGGTTALAKAIQEISKALW